MNLEDIGRDSLISDEPRNSSGLIKVLQQLYCVLSIKHNCSCVVMQCSTFLYRAGVFLFSLYIIVWLVLAHDPLD